MSYRAGVGEALAAQTGLDPRPPRVTCDGCGACVEVKFWPPAGIKVWPPAWFLAGEPPRGWRGLRTHDGSERWDLCPACWRGPKAKGRP